MIRHIVLSLILTFFTLATAWAAPITYTFDNATLTDGQTLTGSLVFDVDTGTYSDVSITNSGTALNPSATWNTPFIWRAASGPGIPGTSPSNAAFTSGPLNLADRVLFLDFDGAMAYPELTGTVRLLRGENPVFMLCHDMYLMPSDCGDTWALGPAGGTGAVYIASGSLQAVPAPATVWLFGSALGLMGWMRRKAS